MAEPDLDQHRHLDGTETDLGVIDSADGLSSLRQALRRHLTTGATPNATVDEIVLVACELATNGLRHGRPPVHVRLVRNDGHVIVDVTDHHPFATPVLALERSVRVGGRGLHLARAVAFDVGWYPDDGIKHVWAQFDRP